LDLTRDSKQEKSSSSSETETEEEERPKRWIASQPLIPTQINYARELLEKRHQLQNTPIEVAWPFVKYMCCCLLKKRKPSFRSGLKHSLRQRLGIKVSKSDLLLEQDPYLRLGYGLNAYFDIILQLMALMVMGMLIMTPLMLSLASFEALQGHSGYALNQFSLGNLGGSSTKCI